MSPANKQTSLLVLGVHLKSEGYPNTLYRLRDLEMSGLFRILEINVPMWKKVSHNRHGYSRLTRKLLQAVFAHSAVVFRYLAVKNRPERVYVPYPGVFVLFLLSYLPARLRPQYLVVDVFITLYDTIVHDRRLLKQGGLPARVLKWIEKRAYDCADKLIVDTEQNSRFLCALFRLPEAKTVVTSLSTDEIHFKHTPYSPHAGICRVLFVGTLVPLHGIGTLLEAVHLLSGRSDIHFKLIGDGQDSLLVEAWLQTHLSQLVWEREWQPSVRVAEAISQADICLGIFGAGNKTQRVCPFKIYAYAAMGRAIISGETDWLKESTDQLSYEPFAKVPVNDATALAAKIVQLADDPALRTSLAESSRKFYTTHLGNQPALEKLVACLLEG
jgi:glycosyltransferase involved in cell wall biosynthesis